MEVLKTFEGWGIVELFDRDKIAGMCTERAVSGSNLLFRIDIPAVNNHPFFTRFIAPEAIYMVHPVTEEFAKYYAEKLNLTPIMEDKGYKEKPVVTTSNAKLPYTPPQVTKAEKPIPFAEALEYMGISKQRFNALRKKNWIVGYKFGKKLYFFRSELLTLRNSEISTSGPIPTLAKY